MANIKPFRGYRYNTEKVGDISNVVCPSLYKLTNEQRTRLYGMSDYNAVRLFSGEEHDTDSYLTNRFTRAGGDLKDWIANNVMVREEKPAIYMCEQTVNVYGSTYSNMNFITLVEIEDLDDANIKPCEEFHETSLNDYYANISCTNANISMISCLYTERDKSLLNLMNSIAETEPDFEFHTKDKQSVHEKVWIITDEETIAFVVEQFKGLPLYITDGQTRYEACLRYRNYMKENNPSHTGKEAYNYTLVSLMNANSDGLVIMPLHREVKCPRGFKEDFFIAGIQDHFKIEKIIVDNDETELVETMKKQISTTRMETKIAVYCGGDYFYRVTLTDRDFIELTLLPEKSAAYCGVDTVVLKKLIFEELLNINDDNYEERVSCIHSRHEAYKALHNGECQVIFILNPVKTEQIKNVTAEGEKLPYNTVNVFPKPSIGTIINVLD